MVTEPPKPNREVTLFYVRDPPYHISGFRRLYVDKLYMLDGKKLHYQIIGQGDQLLQILFNRNQ